MKEQATLDRDKKLDQAENINKSFETDRQKMKIREYFQLSEVLSYFFRNKEANKTSNINLRMMHGINKISIIVFLLGVFYMVLKRVL